MDEKDIPNKYKKLVKSGRWGWIKKTDGRSNLIVVGVRRFSTGEERWF